MEQETVTYRCLVAGKAIPGSMAGEAEFFLSDDPDDPPNQSYELCNPI